MVAVVEGTVGKWSGAGVQNPVLPAINVSAGTFLCLVIDVLNFSAAVPVTNSISDNKGNVWTKHSTFLNTDGNNNRFSIEMWYTWPAAAQTGLVVTTNFASQPSGSNVTLLSVLGVNKTTPFDSNASAFTQNSGNNVPGVSNATTGYDTLQIFTEMAEDYGDAGSTKSLAGCTVAGTLQGAGNGSGGISGAWYRINAGVIASNFLSWTQGSTSAPWAAKVFTLSAEPAIDPTAITAGYHGGTTSTSTATSVTTSGGPSATAKAYAIAMVRSASSGATAVPRPAVTDALGNVFNFLKEIAYTTTLGKKMYIGIFWFQYPAPATVAGFTMTSTLLATHELDVIIFSGSNRVGADIFDDGADASKVFGGQTTSPVGNFTTTAQRTSYMMAYLQEDAGGMTEKDISSPPGSTLYTKQPISNIAGYFGGTWFKEKVPPVTAMNLAWTPAQNGPGVVAAIAVLKLDQAAPPLPQQQPQINMMM